MSYSPHAPAANEPSWHYGPVAIALHWLIAALIVFMAALGWFMMTVEHEPGGERFMNLHKSVGLVLFVLVLLRALWRMFHPPGALPAQMPVWEARLAPITHGLLYLAMLAVPITGIIGSEYSKAGLKFFGATLPAWVAPSRETAHTFFEIHETLVWVLVVLVGLHALAALKHRLVDRDAVFGRMWPGR